MKSMTGWAFGLVLVVLAGVACEFGVGDNRTPTPTPPPVSAARPPEAVFAVGAPAATPTPSPTIPTATPTATATPPPTATPSPTATPIPLPVGAFSADSLTGSAPFAVQFKDLSEGPVTSWEWDFGDGTTSDAETPSHRYTIVGTYTIQLSVSGPGGSDTSVVADLITVLPGPPVSLEIMPSSATLAAQEGTQFIAVARDEFGNVAPGTVAWAIAGEGGSISGNGLFTADTVTGTFADTVTASFQADSSELLATASVTVEPGPVARVVVQPTEVTLDIGDTQQFSFTAFDEFDNETTDVIAAWTVPPDVGAIDTQGLLTLATKAGTFPSAIRLEAVRGTERASASANVTVRLGPLSVIEVQPSFIVVERKAIQQFEAIGLDQYGNEIPELAYQWEATGGEMTQEGLFTAGGETGAYEVSVGAKFRGSQSFGTVEVVVQISCSNVSQIPPAECEALVALCNATNGTNWTINFGWAETDTPCSWRGVTCGSGHVTKLRLPNNQLNGSMPAELGNLSNLSSLSLRINQVSGSIPVELGNLSDLTDLDLDFNQLSGSIPVELGNLSNLSYLNLGNNQLSGSIPVELGNLSNLTALALALNDLSGTIPVELGNLSNLTTLTLHGNRLTGFIPAELGNLSNLTNLFLNRNQLNGSIPVELGNLSNLNQLRLDSSGLSGSIPAELGNLSNLTRLSMSDNRLSGSIPVELGNLSNLTELLLSHNQLLSGPLPQNLTDSDLTIFRFHVTALCESPDTAFQAWLASIDDLQSTGVICS